LVEEERRRGLKPGLIFNGLRGPKGPLFHGSTGKSEFFQQTAKLVSGSGKGTVDDDPDLIIGLQKSD
jgi:hypothetical protein